MVVLISFNCASISQFTKEEKVTFAKCFDDCKREKTEALHELAFMFYPYDNGETTAIYIHCHYKCRGMVVEDQAQQ